MIRSDENGHHARSIQKDESAPPVINAVRDGPQSGEGQYARVNTVDCSASRCIFGVKRFAACFLTFASG
tara:strand:- start:35 stop:241 length:207 start_codon:yes stop_codon:yes gene_type:complete